ncbi:hypothetical protein SmJEL517_g00981 [Synchytrium microbalum]|uniref:Dienelactone hydrolase domain-containing protein n=1 Tax=Synchytrium microbalum TaxID=1806994 RepID=A0A507CDI9_9FUNG|nr:uncharacterized protein SmJEL517_g00981 [Synchytrium microbalum]TPX37239.1 hypothetical protein SmJEL517_g00981 [Synchytrium microbalum]
MATETATPKACCADVGFQHEGTATGVEEKLGSLDYYVKRPTTPSTTAIVIATDIFGWKMNNVRLIADYFCENTGFNVYIPDMFDGKALPADVMGDINLHVPQPFMTKIGMYFGLMSRLPKLVPWMRANSVSSVAPKIDKFIDDIREKQGITKIGMQGYCYGAPFCLKNAANADRIQAFCLAHPSAVTIPTDVEPVKVPSLWLCAQHDMVFTPSMRKKAEELLKGKNATFVDYEGVQHGFASRGDDKEEVVKAAMTDARKRGAEFFKQNL